MKDRDTKGARFRDVMINRRKVKEQTQVERGGGVEANETGISFSNSQIYQSAYFLGQRIGGRRNCGKELKRSLVCLAPHTIQFVQLTRISCYLLMPLIVQKETQCYCFFSLGKFLVTIESYILSCTLSCYCPLWILPPGVTGVNFSWMCAAGLSEILPDFTKTQQVVYYQCCVLIS